MKKPDSKDISAFVRKLIPPLFLTPPAWAAAACFVITLAVVLVNMNASRVIGDIGDFETGKVADRDVVAEQSLSYEDEDATAARQKVMEKLIPPVFHYSYEKSAAITGKWENFAALASGDYEKQEDFAAAAERDFPGFFSAQILSRLYENPHKKDITDHASAALAAILEKGIYSLPPQGLENLNGDVLELIRTRSGRTEREQVSQSGIITKENLSEAVSLASGSLSDETAELTTALITPFIEENVFYSPEDTAQRVYESRAKTEPVIKYIERGKRVIKKGFIITDEDMQELHAMSQSLRGMDLRNSISQIILLLLLFVFICLFCAKGFSGKKLTPAEIYLICVLSLFYLCGTVFMRNISFGNDALILALAVPTALTVMLPAILINHYLALMLAMTLPLGAFITGAFDEYSCVFALTSGIAASFSLRGAEKRMDLISAGLLSGAANCVVMIAILLARKSAAGGWPPALFWAAFNSIASGMLVLGLLPPLEHALNAATAFRLRELSDLNAPILKRLFTAAPGTYSHSILVANLAEAACQDIGANALLARVGAYYHDVGKMESPEYYVENQTDHNKHDEINPRLSATIIKSHVALGVEKAHALSLPREVIEIIGEHHGNSVITWFYNKALKSEDAKTAINIEDFMYPGLPPRSRESAVVMLADMCEAAVRTLDKPTVASLEKYIQDLFNAKVESGQLARSELTFKDLDAIKNAFVRVLVGYYHSRIQYPKLTKEARDAAASASAQAVAAAESAGGDSGASGEKGK